MRIYSHKALVGMPRPNAFGPTENVIYLFNPLAGFLVGILVGFTGVGGGAVLDAAPR